MFSGKSLMYIKNISELSTDPCGTLDFTSFFCQETKETFLFLGKKAVKSYYVPEGCTEKQKKY